MQGSRHQQGTIGASQVELGENWITMDGQIGTGIKEPDQWYEVSRKIKMHGDCVVRTQTSYSKWGPINHKQLGWVWDAKFEKLPKHEIYN